MNVRKILPYILTVASGVGVVSNAIIAAREGKKAEPYDKSAKLKTKAKWLFKNYKGTILTSGLTIGCISTNLIVNKKNEAALLATIGGLTMKHKDFENAVKKRFGNKARNEIIADTVKNDSKSALPKVKDGKVLYYIEPLGYGYVNEEKLLNACSSITPTLTCEDTSSVLHGPFCFTFRDLVKLSEFEPVENNNRYRLLLNFGWSAAILLHDWGRYTVGFDISKDKDTGCRVLSFDVEEIWNPEKAFEHDNGMISDEEYFDGKEDALRREGFIYE